MAQLKNKWLAGIQFDTDEEGKLKIFSDDQMKQFEVQRQAVKKYEEANALKQKIADESYAIISQAQKEKAGFERMAAIGKGAQAVIDPRMWARGVVGLGKMLVEPVTDVAVTGSKSISEQNTATNLYNQSKDLADQAAKIVKTDRPQAEALLRQSQALTEEANKFAQGEATKKIMGADDKLSGKEIFAKSALAGLTVGSFLPVGTVVKGTGVLANVSTKVPATLQASKTVAVGNIITRGLGLGDIYQVGKVGAQKGFGKVMEQTIFGQAIKATPQALTYAGLGELADDDGVNNYWGSVGTNAIGAFGVTLGLGYGAKVLGSVAQTGVSDISKIVNKTGAGAVTDLAGALPMPKEPAQIGTTQRLMLPEATQATTTIDGQQVGLPTSQFSKLGAFDPQETIPMVDITETIKGNNIDFNPDSVLSINATRKTIDDLALLTGNEVGGKKLKINTEDPKYKEVYNNMIKPLVDRINEVDANVKAPNVKVDPLVEEARKYKSAEEFVQNQGIIVYHGSNKKFKNTDNINFNKGFYTLKRTENQIAEEAKYLTEDNKISKISLIEDEKLLSKFEINEMKAISKNLGSQTDKQQQRFKELAEKAKTEYRKKSGETIDLELAKYKKDPATAFGKNVNEFVVNFKNPLTVDYNGKSWKEAGTLYDTTDELIKEAKTNKNDGIIIKNINEGFTFGADRSAGIVDDYIVLDKNAIKTKSELEDIYNKAQATTQPTKATEISAEQVVEIRSKLDTFKADEQKIAVQLDQDTMLLETIIDELKTHPGKVLHKYANKKEGRLYEITGKGRSTYARKGDSMMTELGFETDDEAQDAYDAWLKLRNQRDRLRADIKESKSFLKDIAKEQKTLQKQLKELEGPIETLEPQYISSKDVQKIPVEDVEMEVNKIYSELENAGMNIVPEQVRLTPNIQAVDEKLAKGEIPTPEEFDKGMKEYVNSTGKTEVIDGVQEELRNPMRKSTYVEKLKKENPDLNIESVQYEAAIVKDLEEKAINLIETNFDEAGKIARNITKSSSPEQVKIAELYMEKLRELGKNDELAQILHRFGKASSQAGQWNGILRPNKIGSPEYAIKEAQKTRMDKLKTQIDKQVAKVKQEMSSVVIDQTVIFDILDNITCK